MNANIYARNYVPEKERAELAFRKDQQAMLKKTLFNEKEPVKKYFLRPDVRTLEQRSRMRFKATSQSGRVQDSIEGRPLVSFETFDRYRAEVKPEFRALPEKQKWRTKEGFAITNKIVTNGSPLRGAAWSQTSTHASHAGQAPFIGGLDALGKAGMERKRDKMKEASKRPFEGMVPADNHRIERYTTNSLYAGMSLGGQLKHLELLEVGTPDRKS